MAVFDDLQYCKSLKRWVGGGGGGGGGGGWWGWPGVLCWRLWTRCSVGDFQRVYELFFC